jgi:hypothetical protein
LTEIEICDHPCPLSESVNESDACDVHLFLGPFACVLYKS